MSTDHTPLLAIAGHAVATGAENLALLLGVEVAFGPPAMLDHGREVGESGGELAAVEVSFTGGIQGATLLAFTGGAATRMAELMVTRADHIGFSDEPGMSTLAEAMNQFVAGMARALSEHTGHLVDVGAPLVEAVATGDQRLAKQSTDVVVAWDGTIGPTPGRLYWKMSGDVARSLAPEVGASDQTNAASAAAAAPATAPTASVPSPPPTPMAGSDASGPSSLGRLADVVLDVTVELGRSRIPIREVLALDEGGVIKLGRTVGEPVDLLVNGLATARGEIVVVDGRLGLRVTELIG